MKQDVDKVSRVSKTHILASIISGFKQMFVIDESKDNVISESADFVVAAAGAGPELVLQSTIYKKNIIASKINKTLVNVTLITKTKVLS